MCGAGGIWKISVSSPKLCCEAKAVPKKKVLIKKCMQRKKGRIHNFKELEKKGNW